MEYSDLVDYTNEEDELFRKNKNYIQHRFKNLKEPISYAVSDVNVQLWPQIPFMGTTLIKLSPVTEQLFERVYHIKVNQIPEIIQFVQDTGRLQFVLTDDPTYFFGHEYLYKILEELHPPVLNIASTEQEKKIWDESNQYCQELFKQGQFDNYFKLLPGSKYDDLTILKNDIKKYSFLKMAGFDEYADFFINILNTDFLSGAQVLSIAHDLLAHPKFYPLNTAVSLDYNSYDFFKNFHKKQSLDLSQKNIALNEIGCYLMEKMTYYPTSLDGCKYLMEKYESNDLNSVFLALTQGIMERDNNTINSTKNGLEEILDTMWTDTTFKNKSLLIEAGLCIGIGATGYLLGNTAGLLSTILMEGIDFSKDSLNIVKKSSEKIAEKISKSYSVTIYNFKKKYKI